MNPLCHWIASYPEPQRKAVLDAVESSSVAKIHQALRSIEELNAEQRGPVLDVELLSTYNFEPFRSVLQLALDCLPARAYLRIAPLDAIESHIASGGNHERKQPLSARLVLWRVQELLPEALFPFSSGFPDKVIQRRDQVLERLEGVVRLHQAHDHGVPLFLSTLPPPLHFVNPVFAAQHRAGVYGVIGAINQQIYNLATEHSGVYVLDAAAWASAEGRSRESAALDFVARQPLSAAGQIGFALFIARSLRSLIVPRKKALAIDLDNTLWGGVLGEDGPQRLQVGHEFPGNVHLRIQRELLELKERGIALVLLSKNDEEEVEEAFGALPDMVLKLDDFAVRKINWNPKHENLRTAADELGIGLDSFGYLDDSDFERAQMRQFIPEVLILNEDSDPLRSLAALCETDAFDSLVVTHEDRQRQHDYDLRGARNAGSHQDDLEAFLESLEMEATVEPVDSRSMDRVVTMLAKTNQFNLSTRRHSRAEVERMVNLPGSVALVLRLRDKFGDQGIVALLIATPAGENGTLLVDTFLVSCRALGRGVELVLWAALLNRACRQGVKTLEAEYVASGRNRLVADLYDRLGLRRVSECASTRRYRLHPIKRNPSPTWISRSDDDGK